MRLSPEPCVFGEGMPGTLENRTVAITEHRFEKEFAALIERHGARVVSCPLLEERPVENLLECDDDLSGTDTIVTLTNTTERFKVRALCFWINSNGHCTNAPDIVCSDENFRDVCPRGGLCEPGWSKTDFRMTLTKRQPISWSAYDPDPLPCDNNAPHA